MDTVHNAIAWYQKKIGSYDKQLWEESVEKKLLKVPPSVKAAPKKSVRLKTEYIDVDLIRGSTFTKTKPQVPWIYITRKALARVIFFPFYYKWWVLQTSIKIYFLLLVLYVLQVISIIVYLRNFDQSIVEDELSFTEVTLPVILMFLLCLVHSQTVLAHISHKPPKRTKPIPRVIRPQKTKKTTRKGHRSSGNNSSACQDENSPLDSSTSKGAKTANINRRPPDVSTTSSSSGKGQNVQNKTTFSFPKVSSSLKSNAAVTSKTDATPSVSNSDYTEISKSGVKFGESESSSTTTTSSDILKLNVVASQISSRTDELQSKDDLDETTERNIDVRDDIKCGGLSSSLNTTSTCLSYKIEEDRKKLCVGENSAAISRIASLGFDPLTEMEPMETEYLEQAVMESKGKNDDEEQRNLGHKMGTSSVLTVVRTASEGFQTTNIDASYDSSVKDELVLKGSHCGGEEEKNKSVKMDDVLCVKLEKEEQLRLNLSCPCHGSQRRLSCSIIDNVCVHKSHNNHPHDPVSDPRDDNSEIITNTHSSRIRVDTGKTCDKHKQQSVVNSLFHDDDSTKEIQSYRVGSDHFKEEGVTKYDSTALETEREKVNNEGGRVNDDRNFINENHRPCCSRDLLPISCDDPYMTLLSQVAADKKSNVIDTDDDVADSGVQSNLSSTDSVCSSGHPLRLQTFLSNDDKGDEDIDNGNSMIMSHHSSLMNDDVDREDSDNGEEDDDNVKSAVYLSSTNATTIITTTTTAPSLICSTSSSSITVTLIAPPASSCEKTVVAKKCCDNNDKKDLICNNDDDHHHHHHHHHSCQSLLNNCQQQQHSHHYHRHHHHHHASLQTAEAEIVPDSDQLANSAADCKIQNFSELFVQEILNSDTLREVSSTILANSDLDCSSSSVSGPLSNASYSSFSSSSLSTHNMFTLPAKETSSSPSLITEITQEELLPSPSPKSVSVSTDTTETCTSTSHHINNTAAATNSIQNASSSVSGNDDNNDAVSNTNPTTQCNSSPTKSNSYLNLPKRRNFPNRLQNINNKGRQQPQLQQQNQKQQQRQRQQQQQQQSEEKKNNGSIIITTSSNRGNVQTVNNDNDKDDEIDDDNIINLDESMEVVMVTASDVDRISDISNYSPSDSDSDAEAMEDLRNRCEEKRRKQLRFQDLNSTSLPGGGGVSSGVTNGSVSPKISGSYKPDSNTPSGANISRSMVNGLTRKPSPLKELGSLTRKLNGGTAHQSTHSSASDVGKSESTTRSCLRRRRRTSGNMGGDVEASRARSVPSSLGMNMHSTAQQDKNKMISSSENEGGEGVEGANKAAMSSEEWEDRIPLDESTSSNYSSSCGNSDSEEAAREGEEGEEEEEEKTEYTTSTLHVINLLQPQTGSPSSSGNPTLPDKVSCLIWEMNECKKVDLTALDIGWAIIDKVDSIPESSDYFIIGVLFSVLMGFVGLLVVVVSLKMSGYNRLANQKNRYDKTESSNHFIIGVLFSVLMGLVPLAFRGFMNKSWTNMEDLLSWPGLVNKTLEIPDWFMTYTWRQNLLLFNGMLQRSFLSLLFFFLLSVADRTFKQRLLYAKHFSYLTSSRRARKFSMPHFRLNKVRNIKIWLSLRSYLKRRGPQRSVDVIVSASFMCGISVVCLISLQMLKDSGNYLDFLCNWEMLVWCLALAVFLLRFMTLGLKINKKYRNLSVLITEQINLYLQMEQKPHKKEELVLANNVLRLAEDLLKELESPFKISGFSANPFIYNITKVIVLSAFSAVLTELLGFKLKLHKIKLKG